VPVWRGERESWHILDWLTRLLENRAGVGHKAICLEGKILYPEQLRFKSTQKDEIGRDREGWECMRRYIAGGVRGLGLEKRPLRTHTSCRSSCAMKLVLFLNVGSWRRQTMRRGDSSLNLIRILPEVLTRGREERIFLAVRGE